MLFIDFRQTALVFFLNNRLFRSSRIHLTGILFALYLSVYPFISSLHYHTYIHSVVLLRMFYINKNLSCIWYLLHSY